MSAPPHRASRHGDACPADTVSLSGGECIPARFDGPDPEGCRRSWPWPWHRLPPGHRCRSEARCQGNVAEDQPAEFGVREYALRGAWQPPAMGRGRATSRRSSLYQFGADRDRCVQAGRHCPLRTSWPTSPRPPAPSAQRSSCAPTGTWLSSWSRACPPLLLSLSSSYVPRVAGLLAVLSADDRELGLDERGSIDVLGRLQPAGEMTWCSPDHLRVTASRWGCLLPGNASGSRWCATWRRRSAPWSAAPRRGPTHSCGWSGRSGSPARGCGCCPNLSAMSSATAAEADQGGVEGSQSQEVPKVGPPSGWSPTPGVSEDHPISVCVHAAHPRAAPQRPRPFPTQDRQHLARAPEPDVESPWGRRSSSPASASPGWASGRRNGGVQAARAPAGWQDRPFVKRRRYRRATR